MQKAFNQMVVTDLDGTNLPPDPAIKSCCVQAIDLSARGGTMFFIGNGASAAMASHCAADIAKNTHIHTRVFTDLALFSALSNDLGYDRVYAEPLGWELQPGDILVAISSSGNSPNILQGVSAARERGGQVVTLSGFTAQNKLRRIGDINFYFPVSGYGFVESCHACLLNYWMELLITD